MLAAAAAEEEGYASVGTVTRHHSTPPNFRGEVYFADSSIILLQKNVESLRGATHRFKRGLDI